MPKRKSTDDTPSRRGKRSANAVPDSGTESIDYDQLAAAILRQQAPAPTPVPPVSGGNQTIYLESDASTSNSMEINTIIGSVLNSDDNVEDIVRNLLWTELDVDDEGKVSVNELGRCLRQHGVDVSNFAILRILSDGTAPRTSMDHEQFVDTKDKLIVELNSTEPLTPDDKKKKQRATYLDLWREHSRSKDESGEIPLSNLPDVIFSECNPTKELLNALMTIKSDGSESLNFEEFCEMLDNLPTSGMISEDMLMKAFQTEDADGSGYLSRTQLYSLLIESGSEPLKKEEVDEMIEDCGSGDKFKYTDWVQRVITIKTQSEN